MNPQLVGEYAELEGGALHKELIEMRERIVALWTASDDDKRDLSAKGQKRLLDTLIHEIETAKTRIQQSRHGAERSLMSKAF